MNIPANCPLSYVILHHAGIDVPHFDLMLDPGGEQLLWTWQIASPPGSWGRAAPAAVRIQDHRRRYLTYEGEISNGRGFVRRVGAGKATVLSANGEELVLRLELDGRAVTLTLPAGQ